MDSYCFGRFELRPACREVRADGRPAAIGARAFDTLLALVERRDRVVGAGELFDLVWPGLVVEENNVRQQISALRKLLGPRAIVTIPGRGYRFALLVSDAVPPADAGEPDAGVRTPTNLPAASSSLIGREAEVSAIAALLCSARLLTLIGTGGIGKTRLSIEAATQALGRNPDGIWFVELASLAVPQLVTSAVADVLQVHEEPSRPLLETVLEFLRRRRLLLVLDNCEHLVEACARFADQVLHRCPEVRILATSREALSIDGEKTWRVPSLLAPAPATSEPLEEIRGYAAVRLFMARAADASLDFRLTEHNAAAVIRICHQLDGIPLALELAAARMRAMRVEQIAQRLDDRFQLLTRGSRTALLRHQTLRSLIDWSHDLLSDQERQLLRRLSVFTGSWTLGAVETVCCGSGIGGQDILDLLSRLVEKSLVILDSDSAEPRYRMLETIRQYSARKLADENEADRMRQRHLDYFMALAESMHVHFNGRQQLSWYAAVDADLGNLRAALEWSLQSGHPESGLRIVNALHKYWYHDMSWRESVGWLERLAAAMGAEAGRSIHYARSLYVCGMLKFNFDPAAAVALCRQCVDLSRRLGFAEGMAWALTWLGFMETRKRAAETEELFREALRQARRIPDPWNASYASMQCFICYAGYMSHLGQYDVAERLVQQCEAELASIGNDQLYVGHCRALLGNMALRRGEFEQADRCFGDALMLYREIESKFDISGILLQKGFLAIRQNKPQEALLLFRESLPPHRNYPDSQWVARSLAHLVIAFSGCGEWIMAAQLAGILGGRENGPVPSKRAPKEISGTVAKIYEAAVLHAEAALGAERFEHECHAGCCSTMEKMIDTLLHPQGVRPSASPDPSFRQAPGESNPAMA